MESWIGIARRGLAVESCNWNDVGVIDSYVQWTHLVIILEIFSEKKNYEQPYLGVQLSLKRYDLGVQLGLEEDDMEFIVNGMTWESNLVLKKMIWSL